MPAAARARAVLATLALAAAAFAAGANERPERAKATGKTAQTVVWALGDGADGSAEGRRLADYVRSQQPERFLYLGDVYEHGDAEEFARNYDPLYGELAQRTDPVLGNHEFERRFEGYFPYWKRARGLGRTRARHRAYVDETGWQVIAYSSESDPAAEAAWVRRQAARHPGTCRIAAGHRGRYVVADDSHADNPDQQPVWSALAGRTAVNLIGHNHLYGRLAPIDGVHVVLSGAGGHELRPLGKQRHPVAAAEEGVPTATRLVLRRGALDFAQLDADGRVYDAGTIACAPAR
jgi:acid phosphatase type 7